MIGNIVTVGLSSIPGAQVVPLELEGAKLLLYESGSLAPSSSKGTKYEGGKKMQKAEFFRDDSLMCSE